MRIIILIILFANSLADFNHVHASLGTCSSKDIFLDNSNERSCPRKTVTSGKSTTYVLYDVNPVEGFNLRRDVYIRIVVWIKKLNLEAERARANTEYVLVLPPFSNLYHWRSQKIDQTNIYWRKFFDIDSFRQYTNRILDFDEFFAELARGRGSTIAPITIDEVYHLQHFENMFENGVYREKFEEIACTKKTRRPVTSDNYFGFKNITEDRIICMQFQGSASLLTDVLKVYEEDEGEMGKNNRIVLFLNAETVLHDYWGSSDYWQARRSMRFNKFLVEIANIFVTEALRGGSVADMKLQLPESWQNEKEYREAVGSDFLCAHLRRGDFLYGREKTTPTLRSAAQQIKTKLKELQINRVFLASDCTGNEHHDFRQFMKHYSVFRFKPNYMGIEYKFNDGEVAIIDQIICSRARYFIGTYESTFTYRIYEEREILGYPLASTFNTFCKNDDLVDCEKNSVWPIAF